MKSEKRRRPDHMIIKLNMPHRLWTSKIILPHQNIDCDENFGFIHEFLLKFLEKVSGFLNASRKIYSFVLFADLVLLLPSFLTIYCLKRTRTWLLRPPNQRHPRTPNLSSHSPFLYRSSPIFSHIHTSLLILRLHPPAANHLPAPMAASPLNPAPLPRIQDH